MNKVILFSVVGFLLFIICKELHAQKKIEKIEKIKKIIKNIPPESQIDVQHINKVIKKFQHEKKVKEERMNKKEDNDFVFPAITTISQPITKFINEILNPDLKEVNNRPIKVIRNHELQKLEKKAEKMVEKITPKHTDIVSPNPIDTSEYYFVGEDTSNAWSESNISHHPNYHTADISNELTVSGDFFDSNNIYHDKTSPSSKTHLPDRCFKTENDEVLCKFNDRLHNIPPTLIENKDNNKLLQSIGQGQGDIFKPTTSKNINQIDGQSYQVWGYKNEKVNNGGKFFKDVSPSSSGSSEYLVMDNLPKGTYSF
tara:strand:- start:282 stop:1220 length:939 start_codon:yes stop_codon:yes gene_type:complete